MFSITISSIFAPHGGNNRANLNRIPRPVPDIRFATRAERECFFRDVKNVEHLLLALFVNHELHRHQALLDAMRRWAAATHALSWEDRFWIYHREVEGHNVMVAVQEVNHMVTPNRTRAMLYAAKVALANEMLYANVPVNVDHRGVDIGTEQSVAWTDEEQSEVAAEENTFTDCFLGELGGEGKECMEFDFAIDADDDSWLYDFGTD